MFATSTTVSVSASMGAMMCMGMTTASSILDVSFAKEQLENHGDPIEATMETGTATRCRPVLVFTSSKQENCRCNSASQDGRALRT